MRILRKLKENIILKDVEDCLTEYAENLLFVDILDNKERGDFFKVQNTNKCLIKIYISFQMTLLYMSHLMVLISFLMHQDDQ